jgi:hypothetical protein
MRDPMDALPERSETTETTTARPDHQQAIAPTTTALAPMDASEAQTLTIVAESFQGIADTLDDAGLAAAGSLMDINGANDALGGSLPQIKIRQPTSGEGIGEGVPLGHLYHSLTGDSFEELTITIIGKKWSRQWLGPYQPGKGLQVICEASDGIACDLDTEDGCEPQSAPAYGQPCTECQHKRRPCGDLYTTLAFCHDIEEPVLWFVRSTAIKALRRANTMVTAIGSKGWKALGLPAQNAQPHLLASFRLRTEKTTNDKGTFFVPVVDRFQPITDEATVASVFDSARMFASALIKSKGSELQKASEKSVDDVFPPVAGETPSGGGFGGTDGPHSDPIDADEGLAEF